MCNRPIARIEEILSVHPDWHLAGDNLLRDNKRNGGKIPKALWIEDIPHLSVCAGGEFKGRDVLQSATVSHLIETVLIHYRQIVQAPDI